MSRGVGLGDLERFLPTSASLWFCQGVKLLAGELPCRSRIIRDLREKGQDYKGSKKMRAVEGRVSST